MLEEARRQIPLTEVFVQLAQRDEVESVLDASIERVVQHRRHVTQQRGHRHHIHGVVVKDAFQRGRVSRAEIIEVQPGDFVAGHFFGGARRIEDIFFEIF